MRRVAWASRNVPGVSLELLGGRSPRCPARCPDASWPASVAVVMRGVPFVVSRPGPGRPHPAPGPAGRQRTRGVRPDGGRDSGDPTPGHHPSTPPRGPAPRRSVRRQHRTDGLDRARDGRRRTPARSARRAGPAVRRGSARSAISAPRASRRAVAGTTITVGRWSTAPMALASSASVAGAGAVALTGPARPSSVRQCRRAPISSSRVIQLRYWSPAPILPPRPTRNRGSCLPHAPPCRLRTIPVRRCTVRIPWSAAGWAAASQARHTSARKPVPDDEASVRTSSPRSP